MPQILFFIATGPVSQSPQCLLEDDLDPDPDSKMLILNAAVSLFLFISLTQLQIISLNKYQWSLRVGLQSEYDLRGRASAVSDCPFKINTG